MFKSWRIAKVATIAIVAVAVLSSGAASASTPGHHHHRVVPTGVFGTVASVNGIGTAGTCGVADTAGAFTLDAVHSTTDTVNVTTTTTFVEHGVTTPTFADVCVGDEVGAFGMISSATVSATGVFVTLPVVFGTVASVNGISTAGTCGVADTAGTFILDAAHSTTDTVDVSTTTTVKEHGVTAPTFANVCVGDKAAAVGTLTSDTLTATSVFVTPQTVFGTVAAVNGTSTAGTCGAADTAGTFTLDAAHSTTDTVDVSTTTTFKEHGVPAPTFANVCVGNKVAAIGALTAGTLTATSVFVTPPPTPKPEAVFGTVATVNGVGAAGTCGVADTAGAFTLDAAHGTTDTVDVSTTTTFKEHGVTAPTFANVCVGDKVGAFGVISSGTLTATGVFVTPQTVFGTVASVNGVSTAGTCGAADMAGAFTLDAAHGATDTVDVSTTTTFDEHGVATPTFANVCVGNKMAAVGALTSGTVTATSVFVTPTMMAPKRHTDFGTHTSTPGPKVDLQTHQGSTPGPKVTFETHSTSGPFTAGSHSGHGSYNHGGSGPGGSTNGIHSNGRSSGRNSH